MAPLREITKNNDLGHPLCAHLREGTWAFDYIHSRLSRWVTVREGLVLRLIPSLNTAK